jgi:hypothetical protein
MPSVTIYAAISSFATDITPKMRPSASKNIRSSGTPITIISKIGTENALIG